MLNCLNFKSSETKPTVGKQYCTGRCNQLRKARRGKPTDLYIRKDLSPATLQKTEPLIPKLKAAKQADKIAYFVLDCVVDWDKPASE